MEFGSGFKYCIILFGVAGVYPSCLRAILESPINPPPTFSDCGKKPERTNANRGGDVKTPDGGSELRTFYAVRKQCEPLNS